MGWTDVYSTDEGSAEVGDGGTFKLPVPAPTGAKDDEDKFGDRTLKWIAEELSAADKHIIPWQKDAMEAYRFMANKQLPKDEMVLLEKAQRPTSVFNTAQKFVRYVSGIERMAPEAMILRSFDPQDPQAAQDSENATYACEWALTDEGDFERSLTYEDALLTGIGVEDYAIDATSGLHEKLRPMRFSPLEYMWPETSRPNHKNTRWRGHEIYMDPEDVKRRWPDDSTTVAAVRSVFEGRPDPDEVKYTLPYVLTEDYSKKAPQSRRSKKLKVLEFQWWDEEEGYVFQDPFDGRTSWMDRKRFIEYQRRLRLVMKKGIEGYEEKDQKVYRRVFLLERKYKLGKVGRLPSGRFTMNVMTGHFDEEDRKWYGFFKILIEPQKYQNKFFQDLLEIMAHQAREGWLMEEGAIAAKHRRDFEQNFTKPGTTQLLEDGAISGQKIMKKESGNVPAGILEMMKFTMGSMSEITGLVPTSLDQGGGSGAPAASLRQRAHGGLVLLAHEFDALSDFRREEAQIVLSLLKVIADGRTVVAGQNPYSPVIFQLDPKIFDREYYVYLDDTEHDPSLRAKYHDQVMQWIPVLFRANKIIPDLFDWVDLPIRVREQLKRAFQEEKQMMMQMAQQGLPMPGAKGAQKRPEEIQAEVEERKSKSALNYAKAEAMTKGRAPKDFKSLVDALSRAEEVRMAKERHKRETQSHIVDTASSLVSLFHPPTQGGPQGR